jgi:hypothetical protein
MLGLILTITIIKRKLAFTKTLMTSMEETIYANFKSKKFTNFSINDLTQISLHLSRFRDKEHIVTCDQCYVCESNVNSYIKPCKCKLFTLAFLGSYLHFFYLSCIVFILHLNLYGGERQWLSHTLTHPCVKKLGVYVSCK